MFRNYDMGLDIGNSKFSLCVKGEGVIVSEPSYVAYIGRHLTDKSVVAVGSDAKQMYERAHPGLAVITPMSEGVVVDCRAASIILKRLAKQAGICKGLARPRVLVGALFGCSDVERKAFRNVAESLSCKSIRIVHEPLAAAVGACLDVGHQHANMVLDIGDGATEALIVSQGKTVLGSSMRFGGSNVDDLIVDHLRKNHGLRISRSQARKIKELGVRTCANQALADLIRVKGISTSGLLPCERDIPTTSILTVFDKFASKIATFTLNLLSRVPPEFSRDLIENGIYLCGGASQSLLVKEKITEATNLKVIVVNEPQQAVISGIDKMLSLKRSFSI